MAAIEHDLITEGVAEAILSQKGNAKLEEALLAKNWERHHEQLYARALEQVRQEQQEAEASRQERWEAQKAQTRKDLLREAEGLIEEGITRGIREQEEEFEERRQRLISQRNEWKARAELAESWIIEHIKELLPGERPLLLKSPEIGKFKLHTVNTILSRFGLEVRARLTDTPQVVATETGPQRWEQKSRFRLVTVTPGVIDETADEDEDAGAQVEVSPDGTQAG